MESTLMDSKWKKIRQYNGMFLIILFCLSFVLSDWSLGLFTFSDFIIGLSLIDLLFIGKVKVNSSDIKMNSLLEIAVIVHILLSVAFNDDFVLRSAVINLIKISFYHLYIFYMYKFIQQNKLKNALLYSLNIAAVITLLIGIYITIAIQMNGILPYEFFWTFTRLDSVSYLFRGTTDLIRTRSIFSEPAHFGYFLNIVLALNLFGKVKKIPVVFNILLIVGIIITFSYSSVGVLFIQLVLKGIMSKDTLLDNKFITIITAVTVIIVMIVFKDELNETLINRTAEIFHGEDGSFMERIYGSLRYINDDLVLLGNGIGHTPPLQNIYAYMVTDFGLMGFLASVIFTVLLVIVNAGVGITFIALNFQKGGYLSPAFSLLMMLLLVYSGDFNNINILRKLRYRVEE